MPTEVHQHFDADDRLTGYTVVSRESVWDETSRGRALRLQEYEDSICNCGCGLPVRVAYDPDRAFKVDKFTCAAGRAKARVEREWRAQNDRAPEGWDDGVYHYVVPHDDENDV